jgi:hypothetical protein
MADEAPGRSLDTILSHHEAVPDDSFVLQVMHRVQSGRRRRRAILSGFGLLGAAFGLLGAIQLAEPVAQLWSGIPATALMQAVLLTGGGAAFYAWYMGDDLGVTR